MDQLKEKEISETIEAFISQFGNDLYAKIVIEELLKAVMNVKDLSVPNPQGSSRNEISQSN
jgi:hypothetical protein